MSNMTSRDWESWLAEWRESIKPARTASKQVKTEGTVEHKYLYEVGRGTPKARFFATHETLSEVHGFWVPKSLIVSDAANVVELPAWFNVKIINYG